MYSSNVSVHYAIQFVLGYRYFIKYDKLSQSSLNCSETEDFYRQFKQKGALNLALIPENKIAENFIVRKFSGFNHKPLVEVIYSGYSEYFHISPERIVPIKNYRKQFILKTENHLYEKIYNIIKYYYESSLIETNDPMYQHFYAIAFSHLTGKTEDDIPEIYRLMDEKNYHLMMAMFSIKGVGNMEMHNGLQGMELLPKDENLRTYMLPEWGSQFLYTIFR